MKSRILFFIFFLFFQISSAQIVDTVIICNGDSIILFNNWETQTGNYTDGINTTTLIVNPSPSISGNFLLNGNATQPIPNTYQLTQALGGQSGSAWNSVTLDLTQPFSFDVDLFFGYNNSGADGIAFLLQQVSTVVGTSGGGLGYQGIFPSFGVEFDTYQNGNRADPSYDHLAVQQDGDLNHNGTNNLVPLVGFPPGNINIEDGLWHNVIFSWNPSTFNFRLYFDGILMVNYNNDIVSTIFGGNPYVYWGFTAATGGLNNLQQFRVNSLDVQLSDIITCQYDTVQVNPQINSSFYSYLWSPSYNISNDTLVAPFFSPDTTTTYLLEITNSYGCSSIDSFTIFVDSNNVTSSATLPFLCEGDNPINLNFATPIGGLYSGVGVVNNVFTPDLNTIGTNLITYNYISPNGCIDSISQEISVGLSSSSLLDLTICDTYTWLVNNQDYTTSGIYTDSSINTSGCSHVDSLNLVINYSSSNSTIITICDTVYRWPINGQIYDTSGTYIDISTNIDGCTHIETLQLVVGDSDDINLIIDETNVSCFGYHDGSIILNPYGGAAPYQFTWEDGSTNQSLFSLSAGNYPFYITDSNGCTIDSVANVKEANQVFLSFGATSPICRYEESTLFIKISNSSSNIYTILLEDSILKSFVIDTNGLLISEQLPIALSPNFSDEIIIISITDNDGCISVFNQDVHIEVNQLPQLSLSTDDICIGESSFTLKSGYPKGGIYFIDNVNTNFFDIENLTSGSYSIRYEYTDTLTSCSNNIEKMVTISESPDADFIFGPQPTDLDNSTIFFKDNSSDIISSIWNLGDGTIINDSLSFWYTYSDTGTFSVIYTVTNAYNCSDTLISNLIINPNFSTFIPSAFSPNNDNNNDVFMPYVVGGKEYSISIFNRWGLLIHESKNSFWNGEVSNKLVQRGIYSYYITVYDINDKAYFYTGIVTLLE